RAGAAGGRGGGRDGAARGVPRRKKKKEGGLMIVCPRRWHFCCRLHASDDLDRSRTTAASKNDTGLDRCAKGHATKSRVSRNVCSFAPANLVHLANVMKIATSAASPD